jgi:hypothetical protein
MAVSEISARILPALWAWKAALKSESFTGAITSVLHRSAKLGRCGIAERAIAHDFANGISTDV